MYICNLDVIEPCDLVLIRYKDRKSKEIMAKTGSEYSHVAVSVGVGSAIEANYNGVASFSLNREVFEEKDDF